MPKAREVTRIPHFFVQAPTPSSLSSSGSKKSKPKETKDEQQKLLSATIGRTTAEFFSLAITSTYYSTTGRRGSVIVIHQWHPDPIGALCWLESSLGSRAAETVTDSGKRLAFMIPIPEKLMVIRREQRLGLDQIGAHSFQPRHAGSALATNSVNRTLLGPTRPLPPPAATMPPRGTPRIP